MCESKILRIRTYTKALHALVPSPRLGSSGGNLLLPNHAAVWQADICVAEKGWSIVHSAGMGL